MDWLEESESHRAEFERQREIFNSIVLHAPGIDTEGRRKSAGKNIRLGRLMRYAAGAAAMVAVAVGTGYFMKRDLRNDMAAQTMTISVPAGQRISVTLNDGTLVWLNSETKIEYPMLFGRERRVKIDGEALFDVKHDAGKPFIVETFACNVEVLGTRFNVQAEQERDYFSTALFEGRVKVSNKNINDEYVILNPDNAATLVGGHLRVTGISGDDGYRWPEGLINVGDIPFAELMDKFEKSYGVTIVIKRQDMPHIRYMGKIRVSDGIDHALRVLQRNSDFAYEKDNESNTIYIK